MTFFRKLSLIGIALMSLGSAFFLTQLRFDFDIDNLFPKHDEDLAFYQDHLTQFQSDKSFLIIGVKSDSGVFKGDFLPRIDALSLDLDSLPGVKQASSLTTLDNYVMDAFFTPRNRPFFHPHQPQYHQRDSAYFYAYTDVKEKFISSDDQSVCLYLELESKLSESEGKALLTAVKDRLNSAQFAEHYFSGSLKTDQDYVEALKHELFLLTALSLVLITLILFFTFRSIWGIVIPMLVIALSIIWTMGTLSFFGVSINTMTVILPSIISIVALSDVIHIVSRYQEARLEAVDKAVAIQFSLRDIGRAILLTSLTTAFGFMTLGFTDIEPFIAFGIFAGVGVLYAYVLAVILLPWLLQVFPDFHAKARDKRKLRTLAWSLAAFNITRQHPRKIVVFSIFILLTAFYGMSNLQVNSTLYEELAAGDEYSASLNFFDQYFSGIRPVEIYVEKTEGDKNFYNQGSLAKLDSLEDYLFSEYGVKSHYSLVTQVKRFNRVIHNGSPRHFKLPDDPGEFELIVNYMDTSYQRMSLRDILSKDYSTALVQAKIEDLGSNEIRKKNAQLTQYLAKLFPSNQYRSRITGKALLLDRSNEVITRNLGWGLLGAMGLVALLMGFIFRSFRMVWMSLVPNLMPLVLIAGLMGLCNIGLKMSTAVIFTIAFGIAVDDTIHFLSRLKTEMVKSSDLQSALKTTYLSTGRAIVITSLILIGGFGVLMFSQFQTTYITGFFISLALVFAVFSDLFLLPVLIRWGLGGVFKRMKRAPKERSIPFTWLRARESGS
ncbi:MAG: efflux RND transporter permease subunit [Bacteroidota bacterium]